MAALSFFAKLKQEGWVCCRVEGNVRPPVLKPKQSEKHIRGKKNVTALPEYVAALARLVGEAWVEKLASKGLAANEHLQEAEYYQSILDLTFRARPGTTDFDDEAGIVAEAPGIPTMLPLRRDEHRYKLVDFFSWGAPSFKYMGPATPRAKS